MWTFSRYGYLFWFCLGLLLMQPGWIVPMACGYTSSLDLLSFKADSEPADSFAGTGIAQPSNSSPVFYSAAKNLAELPGVVIENSAEIISIPNNQLAFLLAGGASIVLRKSGADEKIADNFRDHRILEDKAVDDILYNIGGPGLHFGAAGLWYVLAAGNQDQLNKDRAWTMIKALSVTGTATLALKLIINDDTPNSKALAWPSGHTASSFCVASVLDEFYGPQVGIPAYIGAGFIGYRMMDSADHWASDVLFGAFIGYIAGHHVAGKDRRIELAGFEVMPFVSLETQEPVIGVGLQKTF